MRKLNIIFCAFRKFRTAAREMGFIPFSIHKIFTLVEGVIQTLWISTFNHSMRFEQMSETIDPCWIHGFCVILSIIWKIYRKIFRYNHSMKIYFLSFSPKWIEALCLFMSCEKPKVILQISHLYFLMPSWTILICAFKISGLVKDLPHLLHA